MKRWLLISLLVVVSVSITAPVLADQPAGGTTQSVSIPNPIKCNDATCLISQVIRYILGVIALLATLMFVWGGILMLTSGGNADRVRQAKETLAWAAIGIVVIFTSWAVIRFILEGLINSQQ